MIRRWSPCEAKMLKPVFFGTSCHSTSVADVWVSASARPGIRPLRPRVTAEASPESATKNVAVLPLISTSVVTVSRAYDCRRSKP